MRFAVNYHRWILDMFRPYLGKRWVEVGAGTGLFSEMLLGCKPERLSLVEPSGMVSALRQKFRLEPSVDIHHATFAGCIPEMTSFRPDSILYINVLEHIEDDDDELKHAFDTLHNRGRAFIFVPALEFLLGPFDRSIGHLRRYRKSALEQKCRRAGFEIVLSKYFDAAGVLPWWIKYKLLGSGTLSARSVHLYDKYCVPVVRLIEKFMTPPLGKNILLVAEKRNIHA